MTYEVMKSHEVWDCPFCRRDSVNMIHFPKSVSVKRSKTASHPGSKGFHVSPDVYVSIRGCSECGKSLEGVEKRLKEQGAI